MMMTSMNNINRPIQSIRHDKPNLKIEDHSARQCSITKKHEQQNGDDNNHPTKPQHRGSLHTTSDTIDIDDRIVGGGNNEGDEEYQYRAAIDSLRPYDVICGRGSIPFNNIGNRRFRILISMNVKRYSECYGRNRKGLFIQTLLRTFEQDVGIRFFKLKNGQLIHLTPRQIRQKVGHALRDVLAFQESQLELEKLREEEAKKISAVAQTNKAKPLAIAPMTATPRSKEALSSMRSRIDKEHLTTSTIRFQNQALASPFSPPFFSSSNNSARMVGQDSSHAIIFRDRDENQETMHRASSVRVANGLPKMQDYAPIVATTEQKQHSSGLSTASITPHRYNLQTAADRHHFQQHENHAASQNFGSNSTNHRNDNARDPREGNNIRNDFNSFNSFRRRHIDETDDDSFDEDDFVPLPIDHPDQGDDIVEMFGL